MLKLIGVSDPLRNSGMAGGAIAARFTCRVRSFCFLLEGLPGWIMYIYPCDAGYCGFSTRGTAWIAPAMLLPAEGCVGGGGAMIAGALEGCGVDRGVLLRLPPFLGQQIYPRACRIPCNPLRGDSSAACRLLLCIDASCNLNLIFPVSVRLLVGILQW